MAVSVGAANRLTIPGFDFPDPGVGTANMTIWGKIDTASGVGAAQILNSNNTNGPGFRVGVFQDAYGTVEQRLKPFAWMKDNNGLFHGLSPDAADPIAVASGWFAMSINWLGNDSLELLFGLLGGSGVQVATVSNAAIVAASLGSQSKPISIGSQANGTAGWGGGVAHLSITGGATLSLSNFTAMLAGVDIDTYLTPNRWYKLADDSDITDYGTDGANATLIGAPTSIADPYTAGGGGGGGSSLISLPTTDVGSSGTWTKNGGATFAECLASSDPAYNVTLDALASGDYIEINTAALASNELTGQIIELVIEGEVIG